MSWTPIHKPRGQDARLRDYDEERAAFSWEAARGQLEGLADGGGVNIAHEAVDRYAHGPHAEHVALRFVAESGDVEDVTYGELCRRTNRFANVLASLDVEPGDRVFTLATRIPELYVSVLGALKHRAVVAPLFAAFGPEPIRERLVLGNGRVLVTTEALYRRRVLKIRDELPDLEHVLLVRPPGREPVPGTQDLHELMAQADDRYRIGPTDPEDMALLHFTSGTTGRPKGAVHVHGAVLAHHVTAGTRSTSARTTCSGARPILVGSPARRTAPSPRSPTASRSSWRTGPSTPAGGTGCSTTSTSPSGTPRPRRSGC